MPPFQFAFGVSHSFAQVLLRQFHKLAAVGLQDIGGGSLELLPQLLAGLFQQLAGVGGLLQLAVKPGDFVLLLILLTAGPGTAYQPADGDTDGDAQSQADYQSYDFHSVSAPFPDSCAAVGF